MKDAQGTAGRAKELSELGPEIGALRARMEAELLPQVAPRFSKPFARNWSRVEVHPTPSVYAWSLRAPESATPVGCGIGRKPGR